MAGRHAHDEGAETPRAGNSPGDRRDARMGTVQPSLREDDGVLEGANRLESSVPLIAGAGPTTGIVGNPMGIFFWSVWSALVGKGEFSLTDKSIGFNITLLAYAHAGKDRCAS